MSINDIKDTEKGLEQIDTIFWKMLGSAELLQLAKKAGIHVSVEADTEHFLMARYGEKAREVLAYTNHILTTAPPAQS